MRRSALGAVVILLAACGGSQPSPSITASPTLPAATASVSPSSSAAGPAMTFDPRDIGTPGPAPTIVVHGSETSGGVTTDEISFSTTTVPATDAYIVRPASPRAARGPGIAWFHWLETGDPTSSRSEFLDEARAIAARGVVSILVQGTFPWHDQPTSLVHDLPAVEADIRMLRAAVDLLSARTDVDPVRLTIVGHDFGGMYGSVVFGSDSRVAALVMMSPTARWADWFLPYWAHADDHAAYIAALGPLDPVTWLGHADGRPILLQFANQDPYVSADVAHAIAAAAGPSAETHTYDAGHALDAAARADRDAWLAERLGLG